MPADDLTINVRQIAGYGPVSNAPPTAALLIQLAGLGSAYASISPAALVATALSQGGDMAIAGKLAVQALMGGSAQFANGTFNLLSAQKACIVDLAAVFGTLGGVPIATVNDVANLDAALRGSTVWSFNGRRGDIRLWIDDIRCAGGAPIFSPRFEGSPRACTPPATSNSSRLATTAFVMNAIASLGVSSFNGREGAVVLLAEDVTALTLPYAPLDSPNFTGYATSITPPPGTTDGQIATTAFVMNAVTESTTGVSSFNTRTGAVGLLPTDITAAGGVLVNSPALSGVPTAPTAPPGTNTTQLATCAFVEASAVGNYAPINSPAFTGIPTAATAAIGTNTNQLATTAFVLAELGGSDAGVLSFNGRAGAVTLLANDISAAGGATLVSPAFTGNPTAPTQAPGDSDTSIATTAFVMAALAAASSVASFNGRVGAVTLTLPDVTTVLPASATTPLMDGTAAVGTATAWARGDHVHPSDTSRATVAQVNAKLNLSGGTLTGALAGTTASMSGQVSAGGLSTTGQVTGVNGAFSGIVSAQQFNGQMAVIPPAASNGNVTYYDSGVNVRAGVMWQVSNGFLMGYNQLGGANWQLDQAGNFTTNSANAAKPGGGAWAATSDERIKTVVGEYDKGLDELLQVRPVVYTFKGNDTPSADVNDTIRAPGADKPRATAAPYPSSPHYRQATDRTEFVGFIAQELETIFPGMVSEQAGFVDGEAVADLRQVNVSDLVYALVNAVKTLAGRVAALEAA